ncbi:MAG: hypothetical protein HY951_02430 [Bacteroidia bacterium]|nr:hypothetical protein [Bacteroidia bacterium]
MYNYNIYTVTSIHNPSGGMLMPQRNFNSNSYRFGVQGSEKDDEMTGQTGSHFTTYFREADSRILRWWSIDPKNMIVPSESPYEYMGNNSIFYNDLRGDTVKKTVTYKTDNSGNYVWTKNELSSNAEKMLTDYMKTDEGRSYYSQFAIKGQTIGGYTFTESGKYSDYNLVIADFNLSKETALTNPTANILGVFTNQMVNGKPTFYTEIMTVNQSDVKDLVKTHAHENQLHGYVAKYEIDAFKKGGKEGFDKAVKKYNPTAYGGFDHNALSKKNLSHEGVKRYYTIKNQLIKLNPSYKSVFENDEKSNQYR